jgi:pimeloyl-ACP methyl ester carboxylesterase
VLDGLQASGTVTDDDQLTAALRDLLPVFFAEYWQRESEFRQMRGNVRCTYVSSADENGGPEIIDDRETLPTLTVPTLIVVGRYDVPCGTRWAQELHALIPRSRLVVLEDSGHFGHLEEPKAFADAVREFVEELVPPPALTTSHLRSSRAVPKGSVT